MNAIPPDSVDALLFDLGGVVIEIDFDRTLARWASYSGERLETLRARFTLDTFYEQHERGEIGAAEYFDSLRASLGIDISDAQFKEGWNAIYVGVIPGIVPLLRRAGEKLPLYAFTNTNALHQQAWSTRFADDLRLFRTVFVSSELGKRKPEPEAFQAVADATGVELSRMVFFDDSLKNVEGARAVGLRAVQVESIADVEASLQAIIT